MYSVASWSPLVPGPRPSSRSLERNFTCARMRSAAISGACAPTAAKQERSAAEAITLIPIEILMIVCYTSLFRVDKPTLTHLRALEAESVFILREVAAEFQRPVMLYSIGKDSSVMVRLAQKAFYPGQIPFPLLHVDTTYKFKEMIEFRDRFTREIGAKLIVHTNQKAIDEGASPFKLGTQKCCGLLKTRALLDALTEGGFDAAFGGARRDEEKSRAKERVYSFRDSFGQWDPKNQRPELWNLFNGR